MTMKSKVLRATDIVITLALVVEMSYSAWWMWEESEYNLISMCMIGGLVVIAWARFIVWIATGRFSIFK